MVCVSENSSNVTVRHRFDIYLERFRKGTINVARRGRNPQSRICMIILNDWIYSELCVDKSLYRVQYVISGVFRSLSMLLHRV